MKKSKIRILKRIFCLHVRHPEEKTRFSKVLHNYDLGDIFSMRVRFHNRKSRKQVTNLKDVVSLDPSNNDGKASFTREELRQVRKETRKKKRKAISRTDQYGVHENKLKLKHLRRISRQIRAARGEWHYLEAFPAKRGLDAFIGFQNKQQKQPLFLGKILPGEELWLFDYDHEGLFSWDEDLMVLRTQGAEGEKTYVAFEVIYDSLKKLGISYPPENSSVQDILFFVQKINQVLELQETGSFAEIYNILFHEFPEGIVQFAEKSGIKIKERFFSDILNSSIGNSIHKKLKYKSVDPIKCIHELEAEINMLFALKEKYPGMFYLDGKFLGKTSQEIYEEAFNIIKDRIITSYKAGVSEPSQLIRAGFEIEKLARQNRFGVSIDFYFFYAGLKIDEL